MQEQINQPESAHWVPLEITAFLDRLHATNQRIVPNSLIWVKHPTKVGWMVPAVRVVEDTGPGASPQPGGVQGG